MAKEYDIRYADNLIAYFAGYLALAEKNEVEALPMIEDWAEKIGCTMKDLNAWAEEDEDFAVAMERARQVISSVLVKGALNGKFNASFSNMAAKNLLAWQDKQDIKNTGSVVVRIIDEFDNGKPVISGCIEGTDAKD